MARSHRHTEVPSQPPAQEHDLALSGESGLALITVAWLVLLLSLLAMGILALTTSVRRSVDSLQTSIQDQLLAESAADVFMHRYFYDAEREIFQNAKFTLEGRQVSVDVSYEDGKINLNLAPAELLSALFMASGKTEADALALAEAIIDWRDSDDTPRLNGAEADAYANAGAPYGPRNDAFENVGELQYVLGMDSDTFFCVRPLLTTYSRILTSAGDALLVHESALNIGRSSEKVRYVLQWAFDHDWQGKDWADPSGMKLGAQLGDEAPLAGQGLRLRIVAEEGGHRSIHETVLRFKETQDASDNLGYAIIVPARPDSLPRAPSNRCTIP